MKRHILRVPNKASLYTRKDIEINGINYTLNLYTYGNYNGFVHLSELYIDFELVASSKHQYYNRTWEHYTGESAYKSVLNYAIASKDITQKEKEIILGGI